MVRSLSCAELKSGESEIASAINALDPPAKMALREMRDGLLMRFSPKTANMTVGYWSYNRTLDNLNSSVRRVGSPTPALGEVLTRVHAYGVCHGDLMVRDGAFPFVQYPIVPGHEVTGVVERAAQSAARAASRQHSR